MVRPAAANGEHARSIRVSLSIDWKANRSGDRDRLESGSSVERWMGLGTSVFRHNGQGTGRVTGAASKADGTGDGLGIRTSLVRHRMNKELDR